MWIYKPLNGSLIKDWSRMGAVPQSIIMMATRTIKASGLFRGRGGGGESGFRGFQQPSVCRDMKASCSASSLVQGLGFPNMNKQPQIGAPQRRHDLSLRKKGVVPKYGTSGRVEQFFTTVSYKPFPLIPLPPPPM